MRRALLTIGRPNPLSGVNIGDSFKGGFYAGIIDTTKSNIITADASQTGLRYALIVAPKSLENTGLAYKTTNDAAPAAALTRWDGLTATQAMNSSTYPAAQYCTGLAYDDSDGASGWYLPAMDELELIYRNLKPTSENNYVGETDTGTFPSTAQSWGYNPSSDPAGTPYTASDPAQTTVLAFQAGGGQAFAATDPLYWSSTEDAAGYAWDQYFSSAVAGDQSLDSMTASRLLRPVRRLVLT